MDDSQLDIIRATKLLFLTCFTDQRPLRIFRVFSLIHIQSSQFHYFRGSSSNIRPVDKFLVPLPYGISRVKKGNPALI